MEGTGISYGWLLIVVLMYFALLFFISIWTSKKADTETFFNAKKSSPWYLVSIGMIGATLSGVTFISVPGWVAASQFSYFQMVLGYILGYFVIATVLMPMYYRMNLTSIYTYLDKRFGFFSYKTGAGYFILSRTIGASFRLYLVALVIHSFIMQQMGIPFWVTVAMTILLVWLYTFKGGIKTIVWTDALQTVCMILALILTIYSICDMMDLSFSSMVDKVKGSEYSRVFFFEGGWSDPKNFIKQFLAGASIAIVMTGLDQDMMQKNLTCRNIKDAQKNMFWFTIILVIAKFIFLVLGALLFLFAIENGISIPEKSDLLYPTIALNHLSPVVAILFILGLIAAAYSSADSALTALTTSFCVDFLEFDKKERSEESKKSTRLKVHIGFSVLLFFVILIFYLINNDAVISAIFKVAGYTYGPLLGLYAFGFFTKRAVKDKLVPFVCLMAPFMTFILDKYSAALLGGYKFGFELLILNGLLTFIGLLLIPKRKETTTY